MLFRDAENNNQNGVETERVVAELDGARLPFADASFDAVLSSMRLHWINNLPGIIFSWLNFK